MATDEEIKENAFSYVTIKTVEYKDLVEKAARGEAMASAFMNEMELSAYGVTADHGNLIAVFMALYPEDYARWLDEVKKKDAEGEE